MELCSSWVDLLADRGRVSDSKPTETLMSRKRGIVRVSESTPISVSHANKGSSNGLDVLESQVSASFDNGECVNELQASQQEAHHKLKQQAELITRLMADNTNLISQMESLWTSVAARSPGADSSQYSPEQNLRGQEETIQGLMAHIHSLREEFKLLTSNFQSLSPNTSGLLEDLERLTHKNADLCNALAATQYSRNVLEREIILLKRTLLEERSKVPVSISNQSHLPEVAELLVENEKLKELLDQRQVEINDLRSLALSQSEGMKSCNYEIVYLKHKLEELRLSQLTEIDQRCREVDSLKQQLADQLNSLQEDRDSLSHQLSNMATEKECLLKRISPFEEKINSLETKLVETTAECGVLNSHIASKSDHANQVELENMALQSQLVQVRRHLEGDVQQARKTNLEIREQLEMSNINLENTLLELESARTSILISNQQLAKLRTEVEILQTQLSNCSGVNSEMKTLLEEKASRIQHLEIVLHKQNEDLSNSFTELLNVSSDTASLTEMARSVHGSMSPVPSYLVNHSRCSSTQADILSMKQLLADSRQINVRLEVQLAQLKTDNAKLSGSYQAMLSIRDQLSEENARFQSANRALVLEKEAWLKVKRLYLSKVDNMSANGLKLATDLSTVKSELRQVTRLCKKRQEQLDESRTQIQLTENLKEDYDNMTAQVTVVQSELDHFNHILHTDVLNFEALVSDCTNALLDHQQELSDLIENSHICGTVNSMRQCQIEMCDESAARLHGELEVLRARKTVLLCMSEHTSISVCCNNEDSTSFSKVTKLKNKLKLQRKQTNFLRVKLGYTLSELRLYKQLKDTCDQQLGELEECLRVVQRQHQQCAAQLEAAERQLDKQSRKQSL